MRNNDLAIIVIDMQEGFLKRISYEELTRILPGQLALLEHCKSKKIPTIFLEYTGEGPTYQVLKDRAKGIPDFEIMTKSDDNGFCQPKLKSKLKRLNVQHICLAGINAEACVKKTAERALSEGLKIISSKDIIGSYNYGVVQSTNKWFAKYGTHYETHQRMLNEWDYQRTHPPEVSYPLPICTRFNHNLASFLD
ncbi:hypothetical protein COU54_02860 [Candidatus Pacearchaeota archaeon CG10_big_fil_rev_8_21_14_0_10_31_24]|nr:MAG: hypothetical protein COU54_02860 [Candidatus Pacearchaeota archaeon CG10_big_fil_rev_8_21_14_0_10_31_24]